ncbi:LysR substrate-binding domain-containing protein [Phyllobacterium myrsinacearum]|uniref:LysR family glycine cleavage system transcriptional activator n=1 Tax=Phyllobacterium myrsinacearum TaxID=28101 RepID=A0A839EJ99_9HYPH|nr:LysR substrate-binding domain-containing protein [Phyllobacterium myrsinacearum]MBA8878325.1 LysR family glycine cleavage system transcriptional activator [Phyllobacterium myrsinacearum]
MTVIPSLRGLQAVEAAARSGSFVAASEELAISAAAVSQLIRALEDQVGRKLFHRINRRVVLTEAGVEIFPRLANAFNELRSVARELGSGNQRSSLVVSVAPSVAMGWLSSRLPGFVNIHGPVDISLRGEDDPAPFDRDLIDIRLSYGRFHYPEHMTEEIVTDAVYPVCSPRFLAKHDPMTSPASLLSAALIHTDWGPAGASFPSWRNWFASADVTPDRHIQHGMRANSSMAALDLALGGLGITLAQGLFCARQVEAGELVVAFNHVLELGNPYCITTPHRSAQRSVVAAFKAWFIDECLHCVNSPSLSGFKP